MVWISSTCFPTIITAEAIQRTELDYIWIIYIIYISGQMLTDVFTLILIHDPNIVCCNIKMIPYITNQLILPSRNKTRACVSQRLGVCPYFLAHVLHFLAYLLFSWVRVFSWERDWLHKLVCVIECASRPVCLRFLKTKRMITFIVASWRVNQFLPMLRRQSV